MFTTSRRLLGAALLSTAALAGCSDDDDGGDGGTTTPSSAAGTYQMQTVNGSALPSTTELLAGGARIEITGGSFVLRSNSTYTETINTRTVAANGTATTDTQTENGTFVLNGQTIQLTLPATSAEPAFSYEGTLTGNTLSYTFAGTAVVYRK